MMKSWMMLVAVAAFAAACGGPPSEYSSCNHGCDYLGDNCQFNASAVQQCKSACDATKATFDANQSQLEATCKNADDILNNFHTCEEACADAQVMDCFAAVSATCQAK
jgi:hypothetical protein